MPASPTRGYKTPQEAAETTRELRRYISGLIEATMDDPAEDVLSDLAARLKEGDLSLAEAAPLRHILSSPATTPAPT
ncbi:hypothetical protein ACFWD7_43710 [Streptomyces mirabilis]|uniref:hypothetical protein n=1 Tax=Streptomyces mirabilis TaxID=68239 RepID=UPI0036BEAE79